MARHRGGLNPVVVSPAAAALAAWAAPPAKAKKPSRPPGISDAKLVKLFAELTSMMEDKRLDKADGAHFVALYADLHCRVYGIPPLDLDSKTRAIAASSARRMLQRDFDGDGRKMADFVSWVWTREKERETWRRENGKSGSRIEWRWMFGPKMLTDYRLEMARKKAG